VNLSTRRIRAILRKDLREYRRSRQIIATMAVVPLIFVITPLVDTATTAVSTLQQEHLLLYLLGIPAIVPAVVAAWAVAGERQQGTLEPVLTTPIRGEEFLLAKALAAIVPTLAISYAWYGVVAACVGLSGRPGVPTALLQAPVLLALVLFTPLVAGWSIWIAIAISARMNDVRAAAQLNVLVILPTVAVSALVAFNVIHATLGLALGLGAALLLFDGLGWRIVSPVFDRERLIAGTR
jgi:ABC-type transport system involved in multi-copper enzyme maturation permease subunit